VSTPPGPSCEQALQAIVPVPPATGPRTAPASGNRDDATVPDIPRARSRPGIMGARVRVAVALASTVAVTVVLAACGGSSGGQNEGSGASMKASSLTATAALQARPGPPVHRTLPMC
jgi:hypothetical protein